MDLEHLIGGYTRTYGCGSLFRRFVIPNTHISYTWRFVNPKMKQGSLIRTFVALFRRFIIPTIRYSEGSLFR